MPRSPTTNAQLFYAMAIVLAIGLAALAPWLGELSLILTAASPALVVLVMSTVLARDDPKSGKLAALGLTHAGWRAWPWAVLTPVTIHGIAAGLMAVTGLALYSARGLADDPVDFAMNLLINTLIGLVLAFTEEVGWRGYLLPRLLSRGVVTAMLLTGALHAAWHLPLLLGTDLYHGLGNPVVTAALFLVTLTLAGVFYGALRLWTGSIWPVVIAHAAANAAWNVMSQLSQSPSLWASEYLGGESGLLMILALAIIDLALIRAIRRGALGRFGTLQVDAPAV